MKKILFLFIYLSFLTSLYAGSYIKVAAFSKTDNFYGMVDTLEALGMNVAYTKQNGIMRVYAGPFNDAGELSRALMNIKQNVASDAYPKEISNVISIRRAKSIPSAKSVENKPQEAENVAAGDIKEVEHQSVVEDSSASMEEEMVMKDEDAKKEEMPEQTKVTESKNEQTTEKSKTKKYFVGLSAGTSTVGISENTLAGTLPLDISLQKGGGTFGGEAGYNLDESFFTTLNYQQTNLTNIRFHDIFTSLNYKFYDENGFSPYVGALVDLNIKRWKHRPLSTLDTTDKDHQLAVGFQMGGDYYLGNDISVFALYRYIHLNYKTTITDSTNTKEIQHNNEQNFNIGLKYSF